MRTTTVPVPETELARFEELYAEVERTGDRSVIPWDHDRPNPALTEWLDAEAPGVVRCGSRVVVVGCGRGHDARELLRRGYDVTAFDCSESAIRLAKTLDPEHAACYFRASLFDLPVRWIHRFELVVEIHTLQSLRPVHRPAVMDGLARLVGTRGRLLAISHLAVEPAREESGPPWALTESELREIAEAAGLRIVEWRGFESGSPARRRVRALLERA